MSIIDFSMQEKDETAGDYFCESTEPGSSSPLCLLAEREVRDCYLKYGVRDCLSPLRSLIAEKKLYKPSSTFNVGRKKSLLHYNKNRAHSCTKHRRDRNLNSSFNNLQKLQFASAGHRRQSISSDTGSGDHCRREKTFKNEVQVLYSSASPRISSPVSGKGDRKMNSPADNFPFKITPSGHFKLEPNQVVYESKNLSIVAADPRNVMLNITDSSKNMDIENKSTPQQEVDNGSMTTTCLYAAGGPQGNIPFGETTDSFSESDTGEHTARKPSELSLSKMGYVNDNSIDWEELNLPKKSDLQTILMHNIMSRVYTDIQITIGKSVHKCHRSVLQCYCTYFLTNTGPIVDIPESVISKSVFELIYQWMLHKGTDSYQLLRRDNILNVFKAAQFLGIKELEEQCWAFIDNVDVFNEDKAFLLYLEAKKCDNKDIMELMVPRVQRFFLTLVSSKEFVEFSVEEVCTFLRSNYIGVHSEMEVFMAAVRWLNHNWTKRQTHAVELMKCVRFGLINPTTLITIRRNSRCEEFYKIATIPEVSQMIDDGMHLIVSKCYIDSGSDEDYQKTLKTLGLTNPVPRNWAGSERNYFTYQEFLKDLAHYRSRQRLNIKKSKVKLQMDEMLGEEFLSSAVLAPSSHQKICQKLSKIKDGALLKCLPQLQQKEFDLLKKIICRDDMKLKDKRKEIKLKAIEDGCGRKTCEKKGKEVKRHEKPMYTKPSDEDMDIAARKIQKAYRSHSKRSHQRLQESAKAKLISSNEEDIAARKIQKAYRSYSKQKVQNRKSSGPIDLMYINRARSDPSIPSTLLRSSTQPAETSLEGAFSLSKGRDSVFLFGGSNPFQQENYRNVSTSIFQFERFKNNWRKCGHLPTPLHYHASVYFLGKIYVAGGKDPGKIIGEEDAVSRKVWRFDPKTKRWSRLRDMIRARRSFGLAACNNKLYAIGGKDHKDSLLASVEMYNVDSDTWTEVRSLSVARAGLAAAEFKGRIWVSGGLVGDNIATNSVEYYNVHRNMWTQSANMQYSVCFAAMLVVRERLYVVGGVIGLPDCEVQGSCKQVIVWNPEAQTWCLASTLSKPRHAHAAVFLQGDPDKENGQVFIIGGVSSKHHRVVDTVECWQEADDHWIMGVASTPFPVSGLTALALPSDTFG